MAQARHPLNIRALAIFFPFATIPAALHYFNNHTDYFLHNMVCDLSHCILLTPSHTSHPHCLPSLLLFQPFTLLPYPAPFTSTEHYPLELTNILYSPASDRSWFFRTISLIQLPFHPSHTCLSIPQPILPTTWPSSSAPSSPLLPAILPIQAQ